MTAIQSRQDIIGAYGLGGNVSSPTNLRPGVLYRINIDGKDVPVNYLGIREGLPIFMISDGTNREISLKGNSMVKDDLTIIGGRI